MHAWGKGIGPELVQRTVADLLTPERAQSPTDLQPALISLKEQIREVTTAGHPLDDTQKEIALKGLLPKALLDRLDDLEETHTSFELKMRWVERQVEKAHLKALTEARGRTRGVHEVVPEVSEASWPSDESGESMLGALAHLAAVVKGKGKGKGKGWGRDGKGGAGAGTGTTPQRPAGGKPGSAPPGKGAGGAWSLGAAEPPTGIPKNFRGVGTAAATIAVASAPSSLRSSRSDEARGCESLRALRTSRE